MVIATRLTYFFILTFLEECHLRNIFAELKRCFRILIDISCRCIKKTSPFTKIRVRLVI